MKTHTRPMLPAKARLVRLITSAVCGALGLLLAGTSVKAATTYTASWTSVDTHNPSPNWFQDAKFGIYFHWGVFSVPAYYNEWYPRWMYDAGQQANTHHISVYGDPVTVFPYHNFINGGTDLAGHFVQFAPKLKSAGGNFDPDAWAQLFVDAGAQFAGPVSEHHDGFSMWNSTVNEWNSVGKGPKLDLLSIFATAIRAKNLKLLVAMHHAYNFTGYYQYAPKQTDPSLQKLYGQLSSTAENQLWYNKLKEVIDNYQPDIIWEDFNLSAVNETQRLNFLSYYYNKAIDWNKEVVATYKDGYDNKGEVYDYERGGPADIVTPYWLTDDCVSGFTWCYTNGMSVYSTVQLLHSLIDHVSKNGNLLLNIAPQADGTIPQSQQNILLGIGAWLKPFGECIYSTRAWTVYGEGPTAMGGGTLTAPQAGTASDIRFTRNANSTALYAIALGWPGNGAQLKIKTLKSTSISLTTLTGVSMLNISGSNYIPLTYSQDISGLNVNMPATQPFSALAYAFKLTFSGTIPALGFYIQNPIGLLWKGNGTTNVWDAGTTSNWLNGSTSSKFANGSVVTFDDTGANNVPVVLTGTLQPASILVGTARTYNFGGTGALSGTMGLTVSAGTVAFANTGTNSFTGGTKITAGTVALGNTTTNATGLGTGTVTMGNGGGLMMFNNGTSNDAGTLSNNLALTGVTSLELSPRGGFSGAITGSGTLNVVTHYIRASVNGNWSAYSGALNVTTTDSGGADFRLNNLNGLTNSVLNLDAGIHMYIVPTVSSGGSTLDIGALNGQPSDTLQGGTTGGRTLTWRIGGLNLDCTYQGTISEQTPGTSSTALAKIGTGTLSLSGTSTYVGATTVSAGTLLLSGSVSSGNNAVVQSSATLNLASGILTTGTVTVNAGGSLTGCGTINGTLINNGTVVSDCGGALAVNGNVTNSGTLRLVNGSALLASGTFTNNGILDIMTGAAGLPPNFVNYGTVLDSSSVKVKTAAKTGTTVTLTVQTYPGHTYQLQSKVSLGDANWTDVTDNVATQTDANGVMTFTLSNVSASSQFYRIEVGP